MPDKPSFTVSVSPQMSIPCALVNQIVDVVQSVKGESVAGSGRGIAVIGITSRIVRRANDTFRQRLTECRIPCS